MTEMEFVNQALNLKNKTIGVKTTMEHLRHLFEFTYRELRGKNYDEARKIYLQYWHRHRQDFHVFQNLSELEICKVIQNRSTLSNQAAKLAQMGWQLTHLVDLINTWTFKSRTIYTALMLCRSVRNETRRTGANDVRARIEEMRRGKDQMVQVFDLVKQLANTLNVPFVSQYVSMNVSIFTELGKLCDKVAVYSLKIAGEAERTLGTNGGLMSALKNKNSWLNQTLEIQSESKANRN